MKQILGFAIGGIFFLGTGGTFAQTPPGPGACFDGATNGSGFSGCDDANKCATDTPTCAADDTGCVPDTADHEKCSAAVVKIFTNAITCVIKCHCKQAGALFNNKTFNEEACEGHDPVKGKACKDKMDSQFTKLFGSSICSSTQQTGAAAEESTLFADKSNTLSLDAQNGATFCDSTSGAMIMTSDSDDAGFVPANKNTLKCECTVGKNQGSLVAAALKCHIKLAHAFFNAKAFDEESCEETNPSQKGALDKYNAASTKLSGKGICPPCLSLANQLALGTGDLGQVDAANSVAYPCP